ncbi:MAG: hypothetical protein RLY71_1335 [Pseudomonadota bacterium]|jgi:hypothetical protein
MTSADGRWNVTIESPLGHQRREMEIEVRADSFTAQVTSEDGTHAVAGKVAGNGLTWTDQVTQPMKLTLQFAVTVSGDQMTGTVKLGIFGKARFLATRASLAKEST